MTRVVLAGGGSAGHTSPLIATAQWLEALRPQVQVCAVGTARGLETEVVPAAGIKLELIPAAAFPRKISPALLRAPGALWGSVQAAARILRDFAAQVVVGFGGYVSGPVYLAAKRLGIPIVVHEQNALPGLANRLAARLTRYVGTSFPDTKLPNARLIGLPLRAAFELFDRRSLGPVARTVFGFRGDQPLLLVTGGSLGARSINTATTGAIKQLLASGVQIMHIIGRRNFTDSMVEITDPRTGAAYRPVPFVARMELAYALADLMLCRAGANTVAEAGAIGLPAIYVPLPIGNGEQARNAQPLIAADAAVLLDDAACTSEELARLVPKLIFDWRRLAAMAAAGQAVMPRDAGRTLASWVLEVADGTA